MFISQRWVKVVNGHAEINLISQQLAASGQIMLVLTSGQVIAQTIVLRYIINTCTMW